jgi:Glycosyl transferase family 2
MDDVVGASATEKVAQDAESEANRRPDAPAPAGVQLQPWPDGHDAHAGHVRPLAAFPLPQREVRDLVPERCEPLRETAVPAFYAAHAVRVEAVVDEADAHERKARPAGGRIYTIGFVAPEAVQTMPSPVEERSAARRRLAIVPALNEEGSVARVVAEIRAADLGFDVVVVDDGSRDRTAAVAETAGARVLRLPFNLGIGGAVQTGYRYAYENGYSIAIQVDGDGQHDPADLGRLLEPLLRGEADVVIGSRFAGAGSYRAQFSRRPGIRLFAWIVSAVLRKRITDSSSSFRAVNRRALALFSADYPHGFLETVEATVLAARSGLRLVEVPVVMRERTEGVSTLTFARSLWYAAKVLVAVFVSLFRRPVVHHLEEEA